MEDESHAFELTRYLHLNPVRASIVERPEEDAWSNCQDYLGMHKMVARVEHRRGEDRAWDRRLAKLSERLQTSGDAPQKLNVKT